MGAIFGITESAVEQDSKETGQRAWMSAHWMKLLGGQGGATGRRENIKTMTNNVEFGVQAQMATLSRPCCTE